MCDACDFSKVNGILAFFLSLPVKQRSGDSLEGGMLQLPDPRRGPVVPSNLQIATPDKDGAAPAFHVQRARRRRLQVETTISWLLRSIKYLLVCHKSRLTCSWAITTGENPDNRGATSTAFSSPRLHPKRLQAQYLKRLLTCAGGHGSLFLVSWGESPSSAFCTDARLSSGRVASSFSAGEPPLFQYP